MNALIDVTVALRWVLVMAVVLVVVPVLLIGALETWDRWSE